MAPDIDILCIGGGFAGLVSANRAAELGCHAVVLEKQSEDRYFCNSRISTGVSHILFQDMDTPPEQLLPLMRKMAEGVANPELLDVFGANAGRAIKWLQKEGAKFLRVNTSRANRNLVLAPPRRFKEGLDWEGRGGDVLLRTLEANLRRSNGELRRGVAAKSLLIENGACTGVRVVADGAEQDIRARTVVLADGGFAANRDMIRQYISKAADKMLVRSSPAAQGDGLRMAEAAGAALAGFGAFYGHPVHRDGMTNAKLWPFPMLDPLTMAGIVVGADGRRFTDEGRGGIVLSNTIAQLSDPLSATLVFDDAVWNSVGQEIAGANPLVHSGGGALFKANSVEELARATGLPEVALAATVRAHNVALTDGALASLAPPRSAPPPHMTQPMPVAKPPFYAIPLCTGITGSMGGVVIDVGCRALRANGEAIRGLYAAGSTVAGLEGGPNAVYMGGLSKAFILGLLAAETIAKDLGK